MSTTFKPAKGAGPFHILSADEVHDAMLETAFRESILTVCSVSRGKCRAPALRCKLIF